MLVDSITNKKLLVCTSVRKQTPCAVLVWIVCVPSSTTNSCDDKTVVQDWEKKSVERDDFFFRAQQRVPDMLHVHYRRFVSFKPLDKLLTFVVSINVPRGCFNFKLVPFTLQRDVLCRFPVVGQQSDTLGLC